MVFRCTNCGATIAGPAAPGMPHTCNYCGALQPQVPAAPQNPYAPGPSPYGAPAQPYGAPPPPLPGFPAPVVQGPRTGLIAMFVVLPVLLAVVGMVAAAVSARSASRALTVPGAKAGMPLATLTTLSLAQTPDAMTKITGQLAPVPASGDIDMKVNLVGGPYARMNLMWDRTDTSHVKMVYLYADTPPTDYAAVRAKLVTVLGRRFDKDGNLIFQGGFVSYNLDTARTMGEPSIGPQKNAHWKQQVDAGWDVLRSVVLGLAVTVTAADKRDWLGGGYPLTAIGAIDPTVDVDHSSAMMQAAFPAVASEVMIGMRHTVAVDHPWYGDAELAWPNEKGGILEEVMLRPPPDASNAFANQADIEACVQSIVGGKAVRSDEDHLKGTHNTTWKPGDGGEVRVYGHMVDVTLVSHFAPKKMSRAEFTRVMNGLDACGRKK